MTAKKKPKPKVAPEDEKIPAGDPRLRRMWAGIAVTALDRGSTGHYDTISREVGAPSVKRLEEEGWIVAVRSFEVYKILTVQTVPKPGQRVSRPGGEEIRAAMLAWLESLTDDELSRVVSLHNESSTYRIGDGPAVETSTADGKTADTADGEGSQNGKDEEDHTDRATGARGADPRFAPAA